MPKGSGKAAGSSRTKGDPFAELAAGEVRPVYVIDGVPVLVDELVTAIRRAVFPPGAPGVDFNLEQLDPRTTPPARVVDAAQTLPAFAPRRLVIVRAAEHLLERKGEEALVPLLAYFARPSPTTVLVLASDKLDGRTKVYQAAKKVGADRLDATVRFTAPKEHEMPKAIATRAQAMGIRIEPAAARALALAVGVDLGEAVSALERLALYVGPGSGAPIRAEDVEALIAPTREENAFALVDAVAAGDTARALEGLHRVLSLQREPALKFLALVARQYRLLAKAKVARELGVPRSELASFIGVPPFKLDELLDQARAGGLERDARALASIATTDQALKGGSLEDIRAFERLVLALREDRRLDPPDARAGFTGAGS